MFARKKREGNYEIHEASVVSSLSRDVPRRNHVWETRRCANARDDLRRSVSARWYRSRDNRSKLDQTHQTAEIGSKRSSFFCTADRGARAARRAENCNPTPTVTESIFRPRHQLPIYLKDTIAPASELRRRIRTVVEDIAHDAVSIFEPPYTLSRRSGRRSRRRSSGRKNFSVRDDGALSYAVYPHRYTNISPPSSFLGERFAGRVKGGAVVKSVLPNG